MAALIPTYRNMADEIAQKTGIEHKTGIYSRSRASLVSKGMLTLTAMVLYFALASLVIKYERNYLIDAVQSLTEIHQREEHLVALNIMVGRAMLTGNEIYFSPNVNASSEILILENEALLTALGTLQAYYPTIADAAAQLRKSNTQLIEQPSRAVVADVRGLFHRISLDLYTISSDVRGRKLALVAGYRDVHNRLTVEWIAFVLVGIGFLCALMMFFFRHLTTDILRVQERATAIVRGYRGAPLPVLREDELGDLISSVNNMQDELRKHETQMELGRQQQFHKEKMAAIGSLAASVAHEINNPLSAIVGIAHAMVKEARDCGCGGESANRLELIMKQAERVMDITRQLGMFSVPQSHDLKLIDINELVRSTCNFVSFDRRFARLDLAQKLDANLPAVLAVADHVVQVLMNLLINAADALENCTDRQPGISVVTEPRAGAVRIHVSDNGCGIAPENMGKVFTEHFTTKAPGRGMGLGLALCRTLICGAGGDITIDSRLGEGTTVTITLPIRSVAA